jgi:hypothetical protein
VVHAIGGATKAVGKAIGAGIDWLNQTVVSPVVDFVKKNETALAVAGLTLTTIGLTVANVVQVGADPATDTLEVGDLGLLGEKISQMTEEDSAAGEKVTETAGEGTEAIAPEVENIDENGIHHILQLRHDWKDVVGESDKQTFYIKSQVKSNF